MVLVIHHYTIKTLTMAVRNMTMSMSGRAWIETVPSSESSIMGLLEPDIGLDLEGPLSSDIGLEGLSSELSAEH